MLHPSQFQVDEAWIVFQLNDQPIETERDGAFNCLALMDAASCFILGNALIPTHPPEPSPANARELFKAGWKPKRQYPATLFVPRGSLEATICAEASRCGISAVAVEESQLIAFVGEAQQGYRTFLRDRGRREA